jgi:hypothetical protein
MRTLQRLEPRQDQPELPLCSDLGDVGYYDLAVRISVRPGLLDLTTTMSRNLPGPKEGNFLLTPLLMKL